MTLDSLPGSVVFGRMLGIAAKDSGSRADESE
jgi:hypothetical protein